MNLYEKLGFVVEGCMRNHVFKQGAYHDKIWMSLFRPEGT
jgi:RimJ/RimL family protein N-acetyltransferase